MNIHRKACYFFLDKLEISICELGWSSLMTCSLQPHLVVTFFHSSPFLVCLSGEKKTMSFKPDKSSNNFSCLKIYCVVLPVTKPPWWENPIDQVNQGRLKKSRSLHRHDVLPHGHHCNGPGMLLCWRWFLVPEKKLWANRLDGLFLMSFLSIHRAHEKKTTE